ncbi:MAG TPA: hypothetical protein VE084_24680 [Burkholderiaceae bacterium]|nr:hypothetical protein [Burkholderiaceae bacterium]
MKRALAIAALSFGVGMASPAHGTFMNLSAQQLQAIESNSSLVRERIGVSSGVDFSFTTASIQWLDGYIERVRNGVDGKANLAQVLGSYYGEAIRKTYGGRWIVDKDGNVGIEIEPDFVVFPLSKVAKQLNNGPEDSIYSMFTMIPHLLSERRNKAHTPK